MNKLLKNPLLAIFLLAIAIVPLFLLFFRPQTERKLDEAYQSYKQGEAAATVSEREDSFNKALKIFLEVESENDLRFSNGELFYNIANSFFFLDELPYAAYYYYKALALRPMNEKAERNLSVVLNKLGLKQENEEKGFDWFLLLTPISRKLQAFSFFWICFFIAASLFIWTEKPLYKLLALFALIPAIALIIWIITAALFLPKEAVLVHGAELKMDAGERYAPVIEEPLPAGLKVKVLQFDAEKGYYKIESKQGIGFVPQDSLRII